LFFNTINYSVYLHSFINFFEHNFNNSAPAGDEQLALSFNAFEKINTQSIKDYLLTYLMKSYATKRNLNYDFLLVKYHQACTNILYKNYIDSLYNPERGKLKITLHQALANKIISPKNKPLRLHDIFKGKPVIIDCWASWCVPCLKEIPFSKKLENDYKNKIDFIYLSFDKSRNAWLTKNKQLEFKDNSYLIDKAFQSDLASYFGIISIPRYIAFDEKGALITANAPRPSRKDILKKLLNRMSTKKAN